MQLIKENEVDPMSLKGEVLIQIAIEYIKGLHSGQRLIPMTMLRQKLQEGQCMVIEREIVRFAKEVGFIVVKPKNKSHIRIEGEQQLRDITKKAGFSEGFYDDIDTDLFHANPC